MPRLLELFCGTKSVGKVFSEAGWSVTSVDINAKFQPDILANILDLPVTIGEGYDFIWASPPCQRFSIAQSRLPQDIEESCRIVEHTLEIIKKSGCRWGLENPSTSSLKKQRFMAGLPYKDLCYCMYSRWGYKKPTRVWGNVPWEPKMCDKNCGNMVGTRHRCTAQRGPDRGTPTDERFTMEELFRLPPDLIRYLLTCLG